MSEIQSAFGREGSVVFAALMPHAPVLVPAVGGNRGREVAASIEAMRQTAARLVASRPDTLVLISPHSPRRAEAFGVWGGETLRGNLGQFGAEEEAFDLPVDQELVDEVTEAARAARLKTWTIQGRPLDHGAVVPLWFLREVGWRNPIVVLGLDAASDASVVELGEAIKSAAERIGRRVAVLASGDMSHRLQPGAPAGYEPRAREFDAAWIALLRAGRYRELSSVDPSLRELAAEDVVDSTLMAAAAIDWASDGREVLSYEGPFGVGYGVAVLFDPQGRGAASEMAPATAEPEPQPLASEAVPQLAGDGGLPSSLEQMLPRIARDSVTAALGDDRQSPPEPATAYLRERRGVFVTLRNFDGDLRGCVGSIIPQSSNVAREIWRIAREAALSDSRFLPVTAEELPSLRFEISVLYPTETVDSDKLLDPARYGVMVTAADGRRGVLLPAIPGIETVEQQLRCVRKKAGIGWWENIQISRFQVDKFKEAG